MSEPGFKRREAESDLQQQRQQERHGADANAENEPADDAGVEGRDVEQLEIEDRARVRTGVPDVGGERKRADRDHRRDQPNRARCRARSVLKPGYEAQEADARQDESLEVEARHGLLAQVVDEPERQQDAENADRHVDPEDPAPMKIGGDEAAERRTRDRADQRRHGEIGHGADEIALRHGAQQHEPPDRHHHRSAQPLEHARGDEGRKRRRGAAQDRAEREDDDRAAEHRARAEAVGDPAGGGNEHRERQHVGGERELEDDRILMQVERDRRQRGRDDRPVHVLHEQRGRDDEGGESGGAHSGRLSGAPFWRPNAAAARRVCESCGHKPVKAIELETPLCGAL